MEKTIFKEGQAYFFRTEQYDYVGTVIGRYDGFLFLKDAFLIKDTSRLEYSIAAGLFPDINRLSDILHLRVANIEAFIEFNPK